MSKTPMKLVNLYVGQMECRVCGNRHSAKVKPDSNGAFYRGSWQCVHKCKMPTKTESQAYNGWANKWVDL